MIMKNILLVSALLVQTIIGFAQDVQYASTTYTFVDDGGGFCIGCQVVNPENALGSDVMTFSELRILGQVPFGTVSQLLEFENSGCAGDSIFILLENPIIPNDSNLQGVLVETFLDSVSNGDSKPAEITFAIINSNLTRVVVVPQSDFNAVSITLNGLGVTTLNIHRSSRENFKIELNLNKDTTICNGETLTYIASSNDSLEQYHWFVSDDVDTPFLTSNTFTFTPDDTVCYFLAKGCITFRPRIKINVNVNPIPAKPIVTGDTAICLNTGTQLVATSPGFTGSEFIFTDIFNNVVTSQVFNTGPLKDTAQYLVASILNGCTSAVVSVIINTIKPLETPVIRCGIPTITSMKFEWEAVPRAIGYEISFNFGSTWQSVNDTLAHNVGGLNDGDRRTAIVRAIAPAENPCGSSFASTPVECISVECVKPSFTTSKDIGVCLGQQVTLRVTPNINNFSVAWAGTSLLLGKDEFSFFPDVTGDIQVFIANVDQPGCSTSDTLFVNVAILPQPDANFNASIESVDVPPGRIIFFDNTSGSIGWNWDFGDNSPKSSAQNPTHFYVDTGLFSVTLIVTGSSGCLDTIKKEDFITSRTPPDVILPNAFSPNGDNLNETFDVEGDRITRYNITIFNKRGVQLFASNDLLNDWDGLFNGTEQPVGAYFFILRR
jgi:gliding motility-associated-like protein